MSHTGGSNRRRSRYYLTDTGFPDLRPKMVLKEEISADAILTGEKLVGEFQGSGGDAVFIGLSTDSVIDPVNVINDDKKAIIIGHTESITHFSIFHNDGTGPKVVYQIPDRFKDDGFHKFEITINSNNTVSVNFDGYSHTLTTKIPNISDINTLKLVNYGTY